MPITQPFKTSDGQEFKAKADAETHQAVIDAKAAYDEAAHNLSLALAESAITADGQSFAGDQCDYWYVSKPYNSQPRLAKVYFYRWDINVGERNGKLMIGQHENDGFDRSPSQRYVEYDFDKLYANEGKAKEALRESQGEWLSELNRKFQKGEL